MLRVRRGDIAGRVSGKAPFPEALCLMCRPEQVEHYLDGVERLYRNLYEEGVPVRHGSVPESGELEGLELAAVVALGADEPRVFVYMLQQVELPALAVEQAAYEVDRVEMGR